MTNCLASCLFLPQHGDHFGLSALPAVLLKTFATFTQTTAHKIEHTEIYKES
jgi:hypothetical protein